MTVSIAWSRNRKMISLSPSQRRQIRESTRYPSLLAELLEDRVTPTTWTVLNNNATGAGSLDAAVASADTDTSPALIAFSPTFFATAKTIALSETLTLSNASEPITIQGPTGAALTLSGGGTLRDLAVTTGTATLQNLTLTQGNSGSSNGGAIQVSGGGTLTVNDCTISNSSAYAGGGIDASAGSLILENSLITGNVTPNSGYGGGGGLLVEGAGNATVLSCLFTQNTAFGFNGGVGGGIYVYQASATVLDTTIASNTAAGIAQYGGLGGGVASNNGVVDLVNCTIYGNTAQSGTINGSNGNGGGIWSEYPSAAATLINDIVWHNTAAVSADIASGGNTAQLNAAFSVIGDATNGSTYAYGTGNLLNVAASVALTGALGSNGGATQSMAPSANSLLVGAAGSVAATGESVGSANNVVVVGGTGIFAAANLPTLSSGTYCTLQIGTEQLGVAGATQGAFVTAATLTTAGTGYQVGDVLTVVGGVGTMATVAVTSVGTNGAITSVALNSGGFYTSIPNVNNTEGATGGHGSGARFSLASTTGTALTVTRGVNGTTAAAHAVGAPIYLASDQRGQLASSASPSFDIGAVNSGAIGGTGLTFSVQPVSTTTNASFNVGVTDMSGGSPVVGATVTITLAAGVLSGTATAVTNASGVAVFDNLSVPSAGSYKLAASSGSLLVNSGTFTISSAATPTISAASPSSGNVAGGATVIIDGTNFTGATAVLFGSVPATSFTVDSSTQITAVAPAQSVGTPDIRVTTPQGFSPISVGDPFAYASSVTFVVTTTAATGSGSLLAAVTAANLATSPAFITFSPTVFNVGQTITLISSLTLDSPREPITINGPTAARVTISGNSQTAGVLIQDLVTTNGVTATVANLTLSQGNGGLRNGGAVDALTGTLTIDDCMISSSSAYCGGGIDVSAASLILENSVITSNVTPNTGYGSGAGLNVEPAGHATVLSCLVTQNVSSGINGGNGGGIFVYQGIATVIDSTIANNTAAGIQQYGGLGGGVGCNNGTLDVVNSTIYGNTAASGTISGSIGIGGGIWSEYPSSLVTLTNDIVWHNTAGQSNDIASGGNDAQLDASFSVIGDANNGSTYTYATGNLLNVPTTATLIGGLASNGGATQSMAPAANSILIGAAGSVAASSLSVGNADSVVYVPGNPIFAGTNLPTLSSGNYYTLQIGTEQLGVAGLTQGSTVSSTSLNSGGTGYQVGDVITVTGGVGSAATFTVTGIGPGGFGSVGNIVSVVLDSGGFYTTRPGTFAASVTGGHGTAALFNLSMVAMNALTVTRGANGTTAAAHAAGAPIYLASDQRGQLSSSAAPSFDIGAVHSTAIGATSLTFSVQPINTTTNASFNVAITDISGGSPVSGVSITLTLGSGVLNGTTTAVTNASGVAVFTNLSVPSAVTSELSATVGALSASSNIFTISSSVTPTVSAASSASGDVGGGATVIIDGTNFTGATSVLFGSTPATSFTIDSSTQITAVAPAQAAGSIDIRVVTPQGTSATSTGDRFAYVASVTFVVTTTASTGPGSLFAAVNAANLATSPALITFSPTVFNTNQLIFLPSSLTLDNAREPITILGPTAGRVSLNGGSTTVGMLIQDLVTTNGVNATIENLTLTQGNGGLRNGGAVSALTGTLTIDDCAISSSTAYCGGGIDDFAANLLLENSTVTGNATPNTGYGSGAGLNVEPTGHATVISCLFTQNISSGINGGNGGGIFVYQGVATVIDSTIAGNTASGIQQYGGLGGGLGCNNGKLDVVNSTIYGNVAAATTISGSIGIGGGIWSEYPSSLVTLTNDIVWHNTAGQSNDIASGGNQAQLDVYDSLIGDTTGSNINTSVGNILGVATSTAILGSLASNGGPTQSMAPAASSPEIGTAGAVTTLAAAVTDNVTESIPVANAQMFAAASVSQFQFTSQPVGGPAGSGFGTVTIKLVSNPLYALYIQIDGEQMLVTGVLVNANGTGEFLVLRGVNGSTAATHAANASVYLITDQRGETKTPGSNPPVLNMGSVQTVSVLPFATAGNSLSPVPVALSISAGTLNGTLSGTTDSTGTVTFPNLSVPGTGTYTLVATIGSYATRSNSFAMTADTLPSIMSASLASFTMGQPGTFAAIAAGFPAPTFSATGTMPSGVTFSPQGVLSGTPTGTGGTFTFQIKATNSVGTSAAQTFTLTVNQPPSFTSADYTTFAVGSPGSFTVTAVGPPTPAISESASDTLPPGLTLSGGVLSGTPTAPGIYTLNFIANDGISPNATQSFTLFVTPLTTVYVSSAFAGDNAGQFIADADLGTAGNQPALFGTSVFADIADALTALDGTGTIVVNAGAYAESPSLVGSETFRLAGNVTVNSIDSAPGTTIDLQANTLTTGLSVGADTIAGVIHGTGGGLVKVGSDSLTLTGTDTYVGPTTISAGSLIIGSTGSLNSSTVSVTGAGILGGDGSLGNVTNAGIVSPGAPGPSGAVGALTVNGALTLGTGTLVVDLANQSSYDSINSVDAVSGSTDITGTTLSLNIGTIRSGDTYTIISSATPIVGSFVNLPNVPDAPLPTLTIGSVTFTIDYAGGTSHNDVVLTASGSAAGPSIVSTVLNGGIAYVNSTIAAKQHSMVENIVYSFSQGVSLSTSNFTLTGIGGTTSAPNIALTSNSDGTVWTVTFTGAGVNNATHSIGDGEYDLALSGVTGLAPSSFDFFRLLGDMDGNGTVDSSDFNILISSFLRGTADPAYLGADDLDGNNKVDGSDFNIFVSNFLKKLPGTTSLN
jgi:IPT/TIG domain